ncbi:MAG: hypothetical protein JRN71_08005 [Nitrososphaerota archaeon]|nr:hypothetical protein [Nitrososphaerota archaeon]MDG6980924.1 hypothetical protein [Nitrososphaerota archaeon]MDG6987692.1 hypothetical protein [Nitrososphaerota archaeon]
MSLTTRMMSYLALLAIPLLFLSTGQQYSTMLGLPTQQVMLLMAGGFIAFNEWHSHGRED